MKIYLKLTTLVLSSVAISAFAQQISSTYREPTCLTDPKLQEARSKELKKLFDADVKDRENWETLSITQLEEIRVHDNKRRIRVGAIFAEGCFKSSDDYSRAALIFQHGEVPDHYYQAFIWANIAVDLGDDTQRPMVALTIDRYLVSIGKKQLFGSQSLASAATNWCYCMQTVEESFPDSIRLSYLQDLR
ncbi:MAG: hypothetical protein P1U74_01395 [Legionellaceae bacterium]|nr:hypothetical protein [Legionellaceae bacterium]